YEVADAIERENLADLKDELGDLLLQVVFHSQIAADEGHFTFGDVVQAICDKMESRHPHIFGDANDSPGWEALKAKEREKAGRNSVLDGVALALPALLRAQKIQKRAARVGFDWKEMGPVKAKLLEELEEVEQAETPEDVHEEIGDLLFATVNLARHKDIDAEKALRDATNKFSRRFNEVERQAGQQIADVSLERLEEYWQRAKNAEKPA
ncbi:Nucleoside triphosphate pyrophosphohydrolase MazG, partial [hydrothermal vent metagenome]